MPNHHTSTEKINKKVRTRVTLRKGEVISLCRCWQSQKFPLCDGSHKRLSTEHGPVIIETDCGHDFHEDDSA